MNESRRMKEGKENNMEATMDDAGSVRRRHVLWDCWKEINNPPQNVETRRRSEERALRASDTPTAVTTETITASCKTSRPTDLHLFSHCFNTKYNFYHLLRILCFIC